MTLSMQGDRNGGDQADPRVDPRGEGGRGGERRGEAHGAGARPQGRARPLPRAHVPQKHLLPAQEQEQVWMRDDLTCLALETIFPQQ